MNVSERRAALAARLQADHGPAIRRLKRTARRNPWNGREPLPREHRLVWARPEEPRRLFLLLLSFDVGYHSSGWWKNSGFEACWHLSFTIVKRGVLLREAAFETPERWEMEAVARACFGDDVLAAWLEPPAGAFDAYRTDPASRHCWHVRIFVDRATGQAIQPEGEVYDLIPFADGSSPEKVFR
jgi:hypothetical protein